MELRKSIILFLAIIFLALMGLESCGDKEPIGQGKDLTAIPYNPEPYIVELPSYFPKIESPQDNPLTVDGVRLGQHLFYDPILSGDSTQSCASCHFPEQAFTDGNPVSVGIDGIAGTKSSMSLVNLAFINSGFFWDGRSPNLEHQAAIPVEDEIELHNDWGDVEQKLREHETYPTLFRKAFGIKTTSEINKDLATKAMAQFERIIVSADSKYDRVKQGLEQFTDLELMGEGLFFDDDPDLPDAECSHCHNAPMMTSDDFFNNGLQEGDGNLQFPDNARGLITGNISDNGKFKATTLRNITLTAPYMHDGRFNTLDEVLAHYNSGGHPSLNKDPLIRELNLSPIHLQALKAFMNTLTDTSYLQNPFIINPYK
jgi:cytochrome c peroxidase